MQLKQVEKLGPPPNLPKARWDSILQPIWDKHFDDNHDTTTRYTQWTAPILDLLNSNHTEEAWEALQRKLEEALLEATTEAHRIQNLHWTQHDCRPRGKLHFTSTSTCTSRHYGAATFQERRQWRTLARLTEALYNTAQLQHGPHLEGLRRKLSTITTNYTNDHISKPYAKQQQLTYATTNNDNNDLAKQPGDKKLLNNDVSTYQWIKTTTTTKTHRLKIHNAPDYTTNTTVTTTTAEALTAIQKFCEFWQPIWQRERPTTQHATHATTEHLGPPRPQYTWEPLTAQALYKAAQAQKGKAPGMDGWYGNALSLIPYKAWYGIALIINAIEQHGTPPQAWRDIRQCHKPKESALSYTAGTLITTPDKLRPLSIASTWYRTWASARYHHQTTAQRIDTWIHPQSRTHQHHAAATIINSSTPPRYTATIDLSKAFDHLDPTVALATLTHLGRTTCLYNIWPRQARYLTCHNQITTTPTHVNSSIPQGDSWSMLALTAVMQSPLRDINQRWPQSQHAAYVDDRTFTTATMPQLQAITNYWNNYTTAIGMKESLDKTQYWTDGPDCRRQALANYMGYNYTTPSIMTTSHSWVSRLHLLALILPITTKNNFNHRRKSSRRPPLRLLQPQHLPRPKPKPNLKRELVLLLPPQLPKQQPKLAHDVHLQQATATTTPNILNRTATIQPHHSHRSNKLVNHDIPLPGMRTTSTEATRLLAAQMFFAPQRRALFRHLNFQKWSGPDVLCTF